MTDEALILVDIQDVYFVPGPLLLHRPKEAAKNAALLLSRFREENKLVVHIQHNFKMFSGINSLVKPLAEEKIIHKDYPSSFLNTDLRDYLEKHGIRKIVIAGMMSHMCIDTTTRACQDYEYEVTVIEDACTTKDLKYKGKKIPAETVHETFMAALDGMFAKVLTLKEYYENKK